MMRWPEELYPDPTQTVDAHGLKRGPPGRDVHLFVSPARLGSPNHEPRNERVNRTLDIFRFHWSWVLNQAKKPDQLAAVIKRADFRFVSACHEKPVDTDRSGRAHGKRHRKCV